MSRDQHQLPKVAAGLTSKRHRRATLRMIRRAVRDGWNVDPQDFHELFGLTCDAMHQASGGDDGRASIASLRAMLEFMNHNLRVAVAMDELERARKKSEEHESRENMVFGEIEF